MPSIDVAMADSIRRSAWDILKHNLARSVAYELQRRNIVGDAETKVNDVKTAFSSWDNCMNAAYCKWPVIAIIIIGSLILLSIITCVVRCCCCGVSCCCSCFRCLRCCGNCCGCCDPPAGRKHKYLDAPYVPPHHGGYQAQAPMHASFPDVSAQRSQGPPQYAEFDSGRKGPEDSLPQMPSWDHAGSKKVLVEEEGVEMDQLKSQTVEVKHPRVGSPASGPVSPMSMDGHSPYHHPQSEGYMAGGATGAAGIAAARGYGHRSVSPFSPQDRRAYSPQQAQQFRGQSQYRGDLAPPIEYNSNRLSDGYGLDQPYDSPAPAAAPVTAGLPFAAVGHNSPAPGFRGMTQTSDNMHGYVEMPAEPAGHVQAPRAGYAEMSSEPGSIGKSQGYVEMPAESNGVPKRQTQAFELPSDQVAPVELDGGFVGANSASPTTTSSLPNNGMRRNPNDNTANSYGVWRQGTGDSVHRVRSQVGTIDASGAHDRRRRDNVDGASSPMSSNSYSRDPRMRNSPVPPSPTSRSPGPQSSPGPRRTPGARGDQPYVPSPLNSPSPQNNGAYGRPPRDTVHRTYSPAPQMRSPAHSIPLQHPQPQGPQVDLTMPQSPITNNGGFDFTSGYSRPQTANSDRRASESRETASREGYPGFKPYKPPQQGWSGV